MRLKGKVVVITGAARGLGRECGLLFAAEGANLVLTDIDGDRVGATADEITAQGGSAIALQADVSKLTDHERTVSAAISNFGHLDVMFNNAGIPPRGAGKGVAKVAFEDLSEDDFRRNVDVNFLGAVFAARAAVPQMKEQGRGTILFTTSASALVGFPGFAIYGASKAGIHGLVRGLAIDLGKYGIRVNCIAPLWGMNADFTRSPGSEPTNRSHLELQPWDPEDTSIPLKLPEAPCLRDNALAALFLVSDESRYVSGVAFPSTDGATLSKVST